MVSPVATVGYVDTARSTGPTADLGHAGLAHALLSITEMDRVLMASPISFTQAYVDGLGVNDKQYLIRTFLDEGTIATTHLLPVHTTAAADPVAQVHPYGTIWRNTVTGDIWQTAGDGTWIKKIDL